MKALNLFTLSRIRADYAQQYENMMAERDKKNEVPEHEFGSLQKLVEKLVKAGAGIADLEGFYFSYEIPHIGKEMDLLKIREGDYVLNIELKSKNVGEQQIQEQLVKNQYYLRYIAPVMYLITYEEETDQFYQYEAERLKVVSAKTVVGILKKCREFITVGINELFHPNQYLVSPFSMPEKFLNGEYFLTQQQSDLKKEAIELLEKEGCMIGITGKAGSGKTLLLYDLAKEMAMQGKKCCLIHCGIPSKGHEYLNEHWANVDIYPAKEIRGEKIAILGAYDIIFVDETHRIYNASMKGIISESGEHKKAVVCAYDFYQVLSHSEEERNIPGLLKEQEQFIQLEPLDGDIRTGKEINSFCETMFQLSCVPRGYVDYWNIDILYANDMKEATGIMKYYARKKGYVFIHYTSDRFEARTETEGSGKQNTHRVIGQEFDKVIVYLDQNFYYDEEGKLTGKVHPYPDYIFYKMLFQAVSRCREKLCIVVVDNYELFLTISNIKYRMISKKQYDDGKNIIQETMPGSFKNQVNKKSSKIKKILKSSAWEGTEQAEVFSDVIDTINAQITEKNLNRKVLRNGLRLLEMATKEVQERALLEALREYQELVLPLLELVKEKKRIPEETVQRDPKE